MKLTRRASWSVFSCATAIVMNCGCSSVTPVGSYDPVVPIGAEGKCKGHEQRCRDSCSSAGVKESTCFADVNGKLHVHCECREGPPTPTEPVVPLGPSIGGSRDETRYAVPNPAG
jgi:hypothetical protein